MLPKGKSKIAAIIVAKLKEKRDGSSSSEDEDVKDEASGVDPGLESAASDVLKAIKRGDASALATAICDVIDLYADCDHSEGE